MTEDVKCPKCDGCGQIANDDEQTPWHFWEKLPPGSDLSVKMGLVQPLPCPDCKGSNKGAPHDRQG